MNEIYTERQARATVSIMRTSAAGASENLTYVFEQHRQRITISDGGSQYGNLRYEVFGVSLDAMNRIARLWLESVSPVNTDTILIEVFDGNVFVPIFQGVITWSAVDPSGMPLVKLVIEANQSFALANTPAPPFTVSSQQSVSLRNALTTIAGLSGFTVDYSTELSDYSLSDTRVTCTPLVQISTILSAYPNIRWFAHLQRIVVLPSDAPVTGAPVDISEATGMVGNPVYSTSALTLATLFNPEIRPGITLNIKSIFDFVTRTIWVTNVISHVIEPNTPGGQWLTAIAANSYGAKGNNQ